MWGLRGGPVKRQTRQGILGSCEVLEVWQGLGALSALCVDPPLPDTPAGLLPQRLYRRVQWCLDLWAPPQLHQ